MKKIVLLLALCIVSIYSFGVSYYSKPSATPLNADVLANWATAANGTGSQPANFNSSGDTWYVQTVGGLTTAGAWTLAGTLVITKSLTITFTPAISGIINISAGGTLNLNTSGTINALNSISNSSSLVVSAGTTLNMGTNTISGSGTISNSGTIQTANVSTAPLPSSISWGSGLVEYNATGGSQRIVAGTYSNLKLSNNSGTTQTSGGALVINSSLINTAGNFNTSYAITGTISSVSNGGTIATASTLPTGLDWSIAGGTVQYTVNNQIVAGGTYNNVTVSNVSISPGNTTSGNLIIGGNLIIASGIFDLGTNSLTVSGTITNGGTLKTANTSSTPIPTGINWAGTVMYSGSGQTVVSGTYATLTLSNITGTNTAGGDITVNTRLSIMNAGSTLDMGTNLLGGTLSAITNVGTITTSVPASRGTVAVPTGKTWGGTFTYSGASGAQNIVAGTYTNLVSMGNVTNTALGNITISTATGSLNIASGNTFDLTSYQILATSTSSTYTNNGTLKTGYTGVYPLLPFPDGKTWGGSVQFTSSSGGQAIPKGTYNNLSMSNTGGTTNKLWTGNITITGSLTTTTGGIFALYGIMDVTTASITSNGIIKTYVTSAGGTTGTTGVNPFSSSGKTWGGEVQYAAGTGATQVVAAGTYNKLTITCYGNPSGNIVVNGDLSITSTANVYMSTYDLLGTPTSINLSGILKTASTSSNPIPAGYSWTGTGGTGAVHYFASTGGQTVVNGTYDNLMLYNAVSTINNANGNITINNVLTYSGLGYLNLGTNTLSGGFTVAPGSVGKLRTQNTSSSPIPSNKVYNCLVEYNNASGGQTIVSATYGNLVNNNTTGNNTNGGAVVVTNYFYLYGSLNDAGYSTTVNGQFGGTGTIYGSGGVKMYGINTNPLYNPTGLSHIGGVTVQDITFYNGTMNNSSIYLAGNLNVNGTLTLGGILVDMKNYNVNMGPSSTITGSFSNSNMIVSSGTGVLNMTFNGDATGNTFLYPVGDATPNYTPISLYMNSGTFTPGSSTIGVNVVNTKHASNVNTSNYLTRYWNVALANITSPNYNVTSAQYLVGDVVGTESNIGNAYYAGYPWSRTGSANVGGTHTLAYNALTTSIALTGISTVNPSVTLTAFGPTTICTGGSVGFSETSPSGDAPLSYTWAPGSTLVVTTGPINTASPTSNQVYTLTITDGNGFTATATSSITVNAPANAGSIVGSGTTCPSHTDALTNPTGDLGGTWSSDATSIATVDGSGVVTGQSLGSATISYGFTNTCGDFYATKAETIAYPNAITGTLTVCIGLTTPLNNTTLGGGWSSDATTVATVDGTGLVTGVSAGTANIFYTIPATGCNVSVTVTVNALPTPTFTAAPGVNTCSSTATTYTTQGSMSSYVWTISGTVNTDYTVTIGGTSIDNSVTLQWLTSGTKTVTVNYNNSSSCTAGTPASNVTTVNLRPIVTYTTTPASPICSSTTATYSTQSGETSYVWNISGTVNTDYTVTSGGSTSDNSLVLEWLTSGTKTVTVNYTNGSSCTALSDANDNPTVNLRPIITYTATPSSPICSSTDATYSTQSGMSSYVWTIQGTVNTDYTVTTGGTSVDNSLTLQWLTTGTKTVTVNYTNGSSCTALAAASNNTTVNLRPVVTYTATPASPICSSTAATYSTQSGETNYIWTISGTVNTDYTVTSGGSTSDNSVNLQWLTSGVKTVTVSYTNGSSCSALAAASTNTTVNLRPIITYTATPASPICSSTAATYSTQSGMSGYVWSVQGTVNTDYTVTSGGSTSDNSLVLQWLTSGTKTVTVNYTDGNGCTALASASNNTTVNLRPIVTYTATPSSPFCSSTAATYSTQSGETNYIWTISGTVNTDYTVTSGGSTSDNSVNLQWLTSGVKTVTVSYTNGSSCSALAAASNNTTINLRPIVTYTATPSSPLCSSTAATYSTQSGMSSYVWMVQGTVNTDYTVTSGGSSTDNSLVLQWLTSGTKTVTVNYTNGSGCTALSNATNSITINLRPIATYTTTPSNPICSSTAATYSTQSGQSSYVWSIQGTVNTDYTVTSGGTSVDNSLNIQWLTSGTKTVTVNYTNGSSCTSLSAATYSTTVNLRPTVTFTVSPTATSCASTNYTYSTQSGAATNSYAWTISGAATTISGGTAADNSVVLKWTTTGSKTVTVTYSSTAGCSALAAASSITSINPLPNAIGGTVKGCAGTNVTPTDGTAGGTWSSSNTALAIFNSPPTLALVSAGNPTISYTLPTGCYVTIVATVNALPAAITASTTTFCPNSTVTYTDATLYGTWSSSATTIATVNATGSVTGVSIGNATITYTINSCTATQPITVNAGSISAITGTAVLCNQATSALSDATPSGTWSIGTTTGVIATISSGGLLTGVAPGTQIVTYSVGGCSNTLPITVNGPTAITGNTNVCMTNVLTLHEATSGGSFSSSSTSIATVTTTGGGGYGNVTPVGVGTVTISYTLSGCTAVTYPITVNAIDIQGISQITPGTNAYICQGSSATFTDSFISPRTLATGTWISSNTALATIDASTGVLTSLGTTGSSLTITFTDNLNCFSVKYIYPRTPLPAVTGPTSECTGNTITVSDATSSGYWYSTNTSVATVNIFSGAVLGVSSGTTTISYYFNGCNAMQVVTVNTNPVASITASSFSLCSNKTDQLNDATGSGTWRSSNTAIANINSTGLVSGVSNGTDSIYYTVSSCYAFKIVTVTAACRTGNEDNNGQGSGMIDNTISYAIYPNPANGVLNIEQSIVDNTTLAVRIVNYLGSMVYQGELNFAGGKAQISLVNFSPGFYLVELKDTGGELYKFKLVIEN